MRRIEIKVLEELENRGGRVETLVELAELTGKSKGWLRLLEAWRRDFVKRKGRKIRLSSNYEPPNYNSWRRWRDENAREAILRRFDVGRRGATAPNYQERQSFCPENCQSSYLAFSS